MKLSSHRKFKVDSIRFRLSPIFKLRRDSKISVEIPVMVWAKRYKYSMDCTKNGNPLYRDVDECEACNILSPEHLKAIVEFRDENEEQVVLDLS